jgi:rSAM/selenodomain-associated transferase 2
VISVVIPALNEATNITETIESASAEAKEVIVVDGGSTDETVATAEAAGARVITADANRSRQMNKGAEVATSDVLLFLHADTRLPAHYRGAVERAVYSRGVAAGAFSFGIDGARMKHRIVERVVALRCRFSSLPYGDQAIFVRTKTFAEMGGFADMPIMEDYEFVRRLKRRGSVVVLPLQLTTSSRRWQKLGVIQTAVLNFFVIIAYHTGVSPSRLAGWYGGRASSRITTSRGCGGF